MVDPRVSFQEGRSLADSLFVSPRGRVLTSAPQDRLVLAFGEPGEGCLKEVKSLLVTIIIVIMMMMMMLAATTTTAAAASSSSSSSSSSSAATTAPSAAACHMCVSKIGTPTTSTTTWTHKKQCQLMHINMFNYTASHVKYVSVVHSVFHQLGWCTHRDERHDSLLSRCSGGESRAPPGKATNIWFCATTTKSNT